MSTLALGTSLLDHVVVALLHVQIHSRTHPRVKGSADAIVASVAEICAASGTDSVRFSIVGPHIVFEGRPLLKASLHARRLITRIRSWESGGIEFRARTAADDVTALLEVLSRPGGGKGDPAAGNAALDALAATTVRFLPLGQGDGDEIGGTGRGADDESVAFAAVHQRTIDLLQDVTIRVIQGKEFFLGELREVVAAIVSRVVLDAPALFAEAEYEEYDAYTFGHSIRVCLLALNAAKETTTNAELLHRIGTAGLMHDVGKALIPFEVLHKRGRLSPEEWVEMKKHPVLGAGVLLAGRESDPLAVAAAYGHHRTADGHGYPSTRTEYEQSGITRLVKICDCFEALTAQRPYKPAMTPAKAFRVMLDMEGHFDGAMLRHFMRTTGIYPAGSFVRLDTGDVARVLNQTTDIQRPLIEIVQHDGGPVSGDRRPYDLTKPEPGGPQAVAGIARDPAEPARAP